MILDAAKDKADAPYYLIYDVDNDCLLQGAVSFADDEKGEYRIVVGRDGKGGWIEEKRTANIKLIDARLPTNYQLIKRISPLTIEQVSQHFYTVGS